MTDDGLFPGAEEQTSEEPTREPAVDYTTHPDHLKRAKPAADERAKIIREI